MSNQIHSTAVIGPGVKIGDGVIIGPYAVIDGEVVIGDNVEIGPHATVVGWTKVGNGTRISQHASIGADPQDKKHTLGDKTFLEIGEKNIFREFVTINRGTMDGGGTTRIGSHNLFMAYSHVAHDCVVGDGCVLANAGTLAGHVTLEDRVIVGGLTAIHQFVRVGKMAIIGGCSKVVQDIPPFSTCDGHPAEIYNVNSVGLKRAQVPLSTVKLLKEAFRILFHSGLARSTAIEKIGQEIELVPEVRHLIDFAKSSERGLCGSGPSSE